VTNLIEMSIMIGLFDIQVPDVGQDVDDAVHTEGEAGDSGYGESAESTQPEEKDAFSKALDDIEGW
jgi:hypothetical protein